MMLACGVVVSEFGLIGGDVLIDTFGIQPVTLAASGVFFPSNLTCPNPY